MTIAEFWKEHHTVLSLLHGIIITLMIFKIPRIKARWKIAIIMISQFLLTGIMGVLKYLTLLLVIGIIFYGAFISIWGIGLAVITWFLLGFLDSHGIKLPMWQFFLIGFVLCAIWGLLAPLINIVIFFTLALLIRWLGIAVDRLPDNFKQRFK